jgi:TorA maturation chaperone TorD
VDQAINPRLGEDLALGRAVLYRFASEIFRHPGRGSPPSSWTQGVRAALEVCASEGAEGELGRAFDECLARDLGSAEMQRAHAHWIGHTPRAAAMPYETEWCGAPGDLLQFHQISDISAFYKAYGLELAAQCDERADHLSVELAFLHFLCIKEAYARERGMADLAQVCHETQRKFLAEHLARWVPAFCRRLARSDPEGFYGRAARWMELWLSEECRRFKLVELVELDPAGASPLPLETSLRLEDCCVACEKSAHCASPRPEQDHG